MSLVLGPEFGTDAGQLAGFVVGGVELRDVVVGVPMMDLSTTETSQLDFEIIDPGLALLAEGKLAAGTPLDYLDLRMEVAAIETGGGTGVPTLKITARARGIQALKRSRGALVVADTVSPTEWVTSRAVAFGLGCIGEPSAAGITIDRPEVLPEDAAYKQPESDWQVINRLASGLGYLCFESSGSIYFGRPSWLIANAANHWTVRFGVYPPPEGEFATGEVPVCRRSEDTFDNPVTIEVVLNQDDGGRVRPGDKVTLAGVPTFEGDYMVSHVPAAIDGISPVTISLTTPVDPQPGQDAKYSDNAAPEAIFDGELSPFDVGGVGGATKQFRWPIQGALRVIGKFGQLGNEGIDIAAPVGTKVVASKAGRVVFAGVLGSMGQTVVIDHGGGVQTLYGHLSSILQFSSIVFGATALDTSKPASQGQLIGLSGNSGTVIVPMLHFEIRVGGVGAALGRPINPISATRLISYDQTTDGLLVPLAVDPTYGGGFHPS